MARITLGTLGAMVREKRGARRIRDVAQEIDIGPATLLRVESGRVPDLATFGKICRWLGVDPRPLLGIQPQEKMREEQPRVRVVSAHLKVDQTPQQKTVKALAKMILVAASIPRGDRELPDNGDV